MAFLLSLEEPLATELFIGFTRPAVNRCHQLKYMCIHNTPKHSNHYMKSIHAKCTCTVHSMHVVKNKVVLQCVVSCKANNYNTMTENAVSP